MSPTSYPDLAMSAAAAALYAREADDPLRTYQPHPKQRLFIEAVLHGAGDEHWLITSNRFGKSDAIAYIEAWLARYGVPDARPAIGPSAVVYDRAASLWIIGPDWNTMQHTILPKILDNGMVNPGQPHRPFIPLREMDTTWGTNGWHEGKQTGKLKNGSLIQAKSNEQDTIKFAAAGVDGIGYDEEPKLGIYEESGIRVEAGARLRIFGGATLLPPEGQIGGVSWIFPKIIQPFQQKTTAIKVYSGAIWDNPHITKEQLTTLESKYPPDTPFGRIRLGGEWLPDVGGARKYHAFQRTLHVRPQPKPDPHRPLCWCWDFNVTPFITTVGQRIGRRFHVLHEFCLEQGNIPDMVEAFRRHYPTHDHEIWLYGDQTGQARHHQTNQSSYTMILNHMRTYPTGCRLKLPSVNPPVEDRVHAVNNALKDEQATLGLEIDPQCEQLILDLEQVIDDGRGGIKKSSNPRDPYYWRTHASDGAGYWVSYEQPVKRLSAPTNHQPRPIAAPRYAPARRQSYGRT